MGLSSTHRMKGRMAAATDHAQTDASHDAEKLGTFGGVFTPSLLTILGLVLFLRLGFVTGNLGFRQMMLAFVLATSVSVLTTVSLAAIATNLRVGGGGVYFLISRTLGAAFGGAIGLVLYLAMSASVAFYAIGLGEAVATSIDAGNANVPRLIAAGVIVFLLGLAWLGADIATRLQYVVMACMIVALIGYFGGVITDLSLDTLSDNLAKPDDGDGFWVSFAIFFPAVTGFTQGVAMSGDLKTPGKSITTGTFGAIWISSIVYMLAIVTLAMAVPLDELRGNTSIMRDLALAPALIDIGVMAATLSSAIASILGAPRVLQRLAADRLIGPLQPFAKGAGPANNPRRAAALTTALALGTVALGDLDRVAPIISMFFLASYGMINYATYSEARSANTSFRPRFRWFDWRLSLLGTLACIGVIVAIDPVAGALAGLAVFGLYRYLRRSVHQVRWADSTQSFHAAEVRSHLRAMVQHPSSSRDWRPFTVAFAPRGPVRRERLAAATSWIEGGAGFSTVVRVVAGRGAVARKHATRVGQKLMGELASDYPTMYGRAIVAADLREGVAAALQSTGLGPIRPNLALFHWRSHLSEASPEQESMAQTALRFGCNTGILVASDDAWERVPQAAQATKKILVWWADDKSGQLLVLLAWMCTRDSVWEGAQIEVYVASIDEGDAGRVAALLDEARLPAVVAGVADPTAFVATTAEADLVFGPMRIRRGQALGPADTPVEAMADVLPVTLLVQVAAPVDLDVQPDEGEVAALAEARDRATEATERADELDGDASRLIVTAEMTRLDVAAGQANPEVVEAATKAAAVAHRNYLDARARADEAWRLVRELDPTAADGTLDEQLWIERAPGRPAP